MDKIESKRKIIGVSLPAALAQEVKLEAARRNTSIRKLFEEMWTDYQAKQHAKEA